MQTLCKSLIMKHKIGRLKFTYTGVHHLPWLSLNFEYSLQFTKIPLMKPEFARLQHSCWGCSLCWRIYIWVLLWLLLPLQVLEHHFVVGILGSAAERLSFTNLPCCSFSPSSCCWSLVRYQLLWLPPSISPPIPFLPHQDKIPAFLPCSVYNQCY